MKLKGPTERQKAFLTEVKVAKATGQPIAPLVFRRMTRDEQAAALRAYSSDGEDKG